MARSIPGQRVLGRFAGGLAIAWATASRLGGHRSRSRAIRSPGTPQSSRKRSTRPASYQPTSKPNSNRSASTLDPHTSAPTACQRAASPLWSMWECVTTTARTCSGR